MKKIIVSLCAFLVAPLWSIPIAQANILSDDLIVSIRKTLSQDYSTNGEYSLDINSILMVKGVVTSQSYRGDLEVHNTGKVEFDTNILSTDFGWDNDVPALQGNATFTENAYFDVSENTMWWSLEDLNVHIEDNAAHPEVKEMGEGWAEIAKILTEKNFMLDFDIFTTIATALSDKEIAMISTFFENILQNQQDTVAEMLEIIFDTGVFDIRRESSTFVLTLAEDPDSLHLEEILQMMKFFGMPEEEIAAQQELFTQFIEPELTTAWNTLREYLDLEIRFTISGIGRVIASSTRLNIRFDHEVTEFNPETFDLDVVKTVPVEIKFSARSMIENDSIRISFPQKQIIDLGKYIRAMMIMEELSQAQWEESSELLPELEEEFESEGEEMPTDVFEN